MPLLILLETLAYSAESITYRKGEPMEFKPDYGLHMLNDGVSPEVDQYFYDFPLYSFSILGDGMYSTMVDMPYAGEPHALSLDFNQSQLDEILSLGDVDIARFVRQELDRDPFTLRTIDLPQAILFPVRARLGKLQRVAQESFVPLVAQEIERPKRSDPVAQKARASTKTVSMPQVLLETATAMLDWGCGKLTANEGMSVLLTTLQGTRMETAMVLIRDTAEEAFDLAEIEIQERMASISGYVIGYHITLDGGKGEEGFMFDGEQFGEPRRYILFNAIERKDDGAYVPHGEMRLLDLHAPRKCDLFM